MMKRREFVQAAGLALGGLGALGAIARIDAGTASAQSASLTIQWLFHSCVLFEANNFRLLVNPFQPAGCTAGYPAPEVGSDLVLLSSRLLDEGAIATVTGNPRVLFEPGAYTVDGIKLQGVRMDHDDRGGFRFGDNVAWRWQMGDIDIVHLGGAAAPITREQRILLRGADLLFVPVGGGPKNYNAEQASEAIEELEPKMVVPTMYRTESASEDCELSEVDAFIDELSRADVATLDNRQLALAPADIPEDGLAIRVFPS